MVSWSACLNHWLMSHGRRKGDMDQSSGVPLRQNTAGQIIKSYRPAMIPRETEILRPWACICPTLLPLATLASAALTERWWCEDWLVLALGLSNTTGISPLRIKWCQYRLSPALRGSKQSSGREEGTSLCTCVEICWGDWAWEGIGDRSGKGDSGVDS